MRPVLVLLAAALPLGAEFLQLEVQFEGVGCASCIESLEGRLGRVRGVERVEVDAGRSLAMLDLAPENRVRLGPLLSRITQDGTRIVQTSVVARGTIETGEPGLLFRPTGLKRAYRLELGEAVSKIVPRTGATYKVRGVVPGTDTVLKAESVAVE
ncbi:MAG: heavy-metal-associated domain-containing protein [bacterium]|nr:heavy-metal-associated domain-containing protein [bacterium]